MIGIFESEMKQFNWVLIVYLRIPQHCMKYLLMIRLKINNICLEIWGKSIKQLWGEIRNSLLMRDYLKFKRCPGII